jgi:hypothetical protein
VLFGGRDDVGAPDFHGRRADSMNNLIIILETDGIIFD